jgi:hypothetical protein
LNLNITLKRKDLLLIYPLLPNVFLLFYFFYENNSLTKFYSRNDHNKNFLWKIYVLSCVVEYLFYICKVWPSWLWRWWTYQVYFLICFDLNLLFRHGPYQFQIQSNMYYTFNFASAITYNNGGKCEIETCTYGRVTPGGFFLLFFCSIYSFSCLCYGLSTTEIYSEIKNVGLYYESLRTSSF